MGLTFISFFDVGILLNLWSQHSGIVSHGKIEVPRASCYFLSLFFTQGKSSTQYVDFFLPSSPNSKLFSQVTLR